LLDIGHISGQALDRHWTDTGQALGKHAGHILNRHWTDTYLGKRWADTGHILYRHWTGEV